MGLLYCSRFWRSIDERFDLAEVVRHWVMYFTDVIASSKYTTVAEQFVRYAQQNASIALPRNSPII